MSEFPSPPRSARMAAKQWRALATPSTDRTFDAAMAEALPDRARRWLSRSIAPGAPLAAAVCLTMSGEIKLGAWRRFTATQILRPGVGFVWAATARVAGVPVLGFDRYTGGSGEMRWRLGGLVPVMSAADDDVTRSAAGRLAIESVLLPTACVGMRWSEDEQGLHLHSAIDGHENTVDVTIGEDGRLGGAQLQRWGTPPGGDFGLHTFGVSVDEERDFGGVSIASAFRAGWWWGTDRQDEGEFFRARVSSALFR
ncbi:conserved hypothetical protein [Rhodococcus sp. RD6.2]|uniref:DUF6544 family protein n=1 Tax=Rhodococcus sp. RD6.2 TaxID=260936 RepID=UPI00063B4B1E|nr:DUF6544 family protein [Rhodococcus sp. RD6.2]CRK52976.1 conserved hypothetical protein [Rhodococcus sp. RD6.2]